MVDKAIDMTVIRNALVKWIKDSTGFTVVYGRQNHTRPAYPYAHITVPSGMKTYSDSWCQEQEAVEEPEPGKEIKYTNWAPAHFTITVTCFGPGAEDAINSAEAALQTPGFEEESALSNLSFLRSYSTIDLEQALGEEYREAFQKDFLFGSTVYKISYGSSVDKMTITGESLGITIEVDSTEV